MRGISAWLRGLALACPLAACGGAGPDSQDDCGVPIEIRIVVATTLPPGRLGETDRCAPGGTEIRVLSGLTGVTAVRLVAHELAHAAGFSQHLPDPFCLLYEDILPVLPGPCPQELAWLGSVGGRLFVSAAAEVRDAAAAAVAHWNLALGRELFVLL